MTPSTEQDSSYDFLICRNQSNNNYQVYRVDTSANELFTPVSLSVTASFDSSYRMAQVGGYLLQWGPKTIRTSTDKDGKTQSTPSYHYNLLPFDPASSDPLNATPLQTGYWEKEKFWGYRDYYSDNPNEDQNLDLTPMSSFVLNMIPAAGRGTYELWNFDPQPTAPGNADPIPEPYSGQGGFPLIKAGHTLIPIGNYVIDRLPDGKHFRLWSFDPQLHPPLALPAVQEGCWDKIDADHQLTVIGNQVLDWNPTTGDYRLWGFDPEHQDVLTGPVCSGSLPAGIDANSVLTGYQPKVPVHAENATTPGNLDFMRSKIKHVVYYMIESRSFDNVCGWLYEKGDQDCNFIGTDGPFDGASTDDYNYGFSSDGSFPDKDNKVHVSQYQDGKLSDQYNLMALDQDPFHDTTDALQQMFSQEPGYWGQDKPDMGGFILNNANPQVMETFSPEQLPILNGLAKSFSISDEWFSSIPGGTDVNRAYSVTGSAFNMLGTWEGGNIYKYFPDFPRRQSVWKTLWSQGITDWKIYYSMLWKDAVFTDQLYLQGQIPTVDANPKDYIAPMDQFKQDAANGNLPAFSFLEPFWYKKDGTTSYHPGTDLVPAEVALNEIYEAVKNGPGWNETLLIITFDKNNGTYDHVAPPYAKKAWPNDRNNGFKYDIMGSRVPTIMVSPWIKEKSVFRAEGDVPFDATSFPATLLKWFGVPKAKWGLGDRMDVAPTFEKIFQAEAARTDAPTLTPPYDKTYPKKQ